MTGRGASRGAFLDGHERYLQPWFLTSASDDLGSVQGIVEIGRPALRMGILAGKGSVLFWLLSLLFGLPRDVLSNWSVLGAK